MECPHCQNSEISASGVCLVCGRQVAAGANISVSESGKRQSEESPGMSGRNPYKAAEEPSPKEELPQWRKDLSNRLQEIKQQKDAAAAAGKQAENKPELSSVIHNRAAARPEPAPARFVEKPAIRRAPQMPRKPPPRQKPLEPLKQQPVKQESTGPKSAVKTTDKREIEALIDTAISRQSETLRTPVPVKKDFGSVPEPYRNSEGKLIFLSRTLSGLIDLICIVFFVGGFIIAADLFGGIIVLDSISLVGFAALFLLTYFVYSIFFLASSGQTIGMMITDLRVVGIAGLSPSLGQFLKRCWWHLVSLLVFGIGLLWGLFDRQNQCLHDRLSGTRVVRS